MTPALTAIGLDLDASLAPQIRLRQRLRLLADFTDLHDALRLRTDEPTARAAAGRLAELRRAHPDPLLTFIGSGDFHHVALLLLETLPEHARPFTLVLIDNHPDWFLESPKYHCGNWLSSALNLPGVEQVVLIGQDSADLVWYRFYRAPFDALCTGRLTIHPLRLQSRRVPLRWPNPRLTTIPPAIPGLRHPSAARDDGHVEPASPEDPPRSRRHPWGTQLQFQSVRASAGLFAAIAGRLQGRNVYLSIDKDCLAPADAVCDWEQGGLSLDELHDLVSRLHSACRIIGADICGDESPLPLTGFIKRLDAARLRNRLSDPAAAARVNERTNLALLDALGVAAPGPATVEAQACS